MAIIQTPIIESPCRNICKIDKAGSLCTGCGRTLDEIARWQNMAPVQRCEIMKRLKNWPVSED